MLHILKDLINRLFGFKDKKINKPKLTLVVNNTDNQEGKSENAYFSTIEEYFTFEEDIKDGRKKVTPYWRTIKSDGKINGKYPGGISLQKKIS